MSAVLAAGGDLHTPSHTDEFGGGDTNPSKSPVRDQELATLMDCDVNTLQLPPETEIYEAALTLGNMNLAAAASPGPLPTGPKPEEEPITVVSDSERMPPPPARDEAGGIQNTSTGYRPVRFDDSDSDEETQDDFNAKWPVRFTEKCRTKNAHGKFPVVDAGTCNSITRHLSNEDCATLPLGCFDSFNKLYTCLQTHRALRVGVHKAGMELERESIRQRTRLSGSGSESEMVTSTWWRETKYMAQVVAKTLARVESAKVPATPTKSGRLLTPAEFKASESAQMEAEALKEDIRIAKENKRMADEKKEEQAKKSLLDSTDDELETIDLQTTKLKAQQKILTERGRKLRKERKAAEKEEKKVEEQLKRETRQKKKDDEKAAAAAKAKEVETVDRKGGG